MIQHELQQIIHTGDRLTNSEVRKVLQSLYDKYQIKKKARATDILLFGILSKRAIIMKDGKRNEGMRIDGIK